MCTLLICLFPSALGLGGAASARADRNTVFDKGVPGHRGGNNPGCAIQADDSTRDAPHMVTGATRPDLEARCDALALDAGFELVAWTRLRAHRT